MEKKKLQPSALRKKQEDEEKNRKLLEAEKKELEDSKWRQLEEKKRLELEILQKKKQMEEEEENMKRLEAEKKLLEDAERKKLDEKRRLELAENKRLQEEEDRRRAEAEKKRLKEQERKELEDKQRHEEDERKFWQEEADKKRAELEKKRLQAIQRKEMEERRRILEADRKRFEQRMQLEQSEKDKRLQEIQSMYTVEESADFATTSAGVRMPRLICATFCKGDDTEELVVRAVKSGFRGVDTSGQPKHYNERAVGTALQSLISSGVVKRSDLFVQTKVNPNHAEDMLPGGSVSEQVEAAIDASLSNLGVSYVDSLLLQSMYEEDEETADAWQAMEESVKAGKVLQLGVSNLKSVEQLRWLYDYVSVKPAVVQQRFLKQRELESDIDTFCGEKRIWCQALWAFKDCHDGLKPVRRAVMTGKPMVALDETIVCYDIDSAFHANVSMKSVTLAESREARRIEQGKESREARRLGKKVENADAKNSQIVPCLDRAPAIGEMVAHASSSHITLDDAKGNASAWHLLPGETALVVEIDDIGDFKLRNPHRVISEFSMRDFFVYIHTGSSSKHRDNKDGLVGAGSRDAEVPADAAPDPVPKAKTKSSRSLFSRRTRG